ncbi:VCBS repeat-containing protein, partial [Bradyrhizobium sp. Rc2d]
ESFTITLDDGNGGLITRQIDVTITGTNDAPVLSDTTNPAAVTELGDASVQNLAAITGSFSVLDKDVGNMLTASVVGSPTVLLNGSAFTLPAGAAALTAAGAFSLTNATQTSNGGSLSVNYQYDPTAANLDFLKQGDSLTITYQVKVNDGNVDSAIQDVTFTITGTNDAPVLNANGGSLSYKENQAAAAIVSLLTVTDVDSTILTDATVSITGNFASGQDVLGFTNQNGIIGSYNASTGVLILTGSATVAQYQSALRSVTYFNSSDDPSGAIRTISYQVNDGSLSNNLSSVATTTVSVTPVNDAPTLSASAISAIFTEGAGSSQAAPVSVFTGASITTVEAGQTIKGLTFTVSGLLDGSNEKIIVDGTVFSLTDATTGTTSGGNSLGYSVSVSGSTATVMLTSAGGISTLAAEAVVNGIAYQNANIDNPSAGTRAVTLISIQDSGGTVNGGVDTKSLATFAELTGANNPLNVDVGDYANPAFVDLNGDGKLDVVIGADDGTLQYFRNTGTATAPVYVQQTGPNNPFNGRDVGSHADPTFVDLDGDGDLDAVVGEFGARLLYYKNTGTATAPFFEFQNDFSNPFFGITVGGVGSHYAAPVFADLDGDGDKDAVVGAQDGTLFYFKNTGTASAPAFSAQVGVNNPFNGITVGFDNYSNPAVLDVDGDGKLDVVVGERNGTLHYLKNVGTSATPAFVEQIDGNNPFNGLDFGDFSGATFADIDGDGKPDAFIGTSDGKIHYLQNVTASATVTVVAANDPPTATNLSAPETYTEGTPLNLTDIAVSDVDNTSVTATLTLSNAAVGSLSTATSGSVTSTYDAGSGVWTASGAIADVNALLASVMFTPTANFNGNFTVATSVSDGVAPAITGTKAFTGIPVNHAPTATNLSTAESYTEDTPLNLTEIVVSDVDGGNVTVILTLSNTAAGSLSTATSGAVTSTYIAGTGVWTASGAIADVNALLAGVTFTPAANFNGGFTVATSVSDGVAPAITGHKTFTGIAVNDAPVNVVPSAKMVAEDTNLSITGLSVSDVDAGTASITTTLSVAHGTLTVLSAGGATVSGSGSATVTLTGTQAQINTTLAAANNVIYRGVQDFNGDDTLTITTNDGGNTGSTGALSDVDTVAITVTAVNDAPTNLTISSSEVVENLAGATIGLLSVTDPDVGDVATYTIRPVFDGALFTISGNELRVGSAALDYEASPTRTVTVRATDSAGTFVERTLVIDVLDRAEVTLTGGADIITASSENTQFIGNSTTLNSTDNLDGGTGTDSLVLYGSGTFNLNSL